jgi:hypothetical protein
MVFLNVIQHRYKLLEEHISFMMRLEAEDRDSRFHQNVGTYLPNYTVSLPRRS